MKWLSRFGVPFFWWRVYAGRILVKKNMCMSRAVGTQCAAKVSVDIYFTGTLLQHPLQTYGFSPSALSSQQPRPCSGEIRRSSRSALLDALWSDSVWPISGPLLVRSGPP